jgi:flavin-dependent dehydrogenase
LVKTRVAGSSGPFDDFDVAVVGAGPAGATAAWYLARGAPGLPPPRVALLEKARFPRDKVCGDAWCAPALDILEEMGVLGKLEAEGRLRDTRAGGFVSPAGQSFVSDGASEAGSGTRVFAIKRSICDERIARAAAAAGATLFEGAAVARAALEADGFWSLRCTDGRVFRARVLVAADGAQSRLARRLGLVTTPPTGFASRRYVTGGTHNFRADGVLLYPTYILPGYVALFRHFDDDIDLGSYVIPGGAASAKDLPRIYETRVRHDPFLRAVLGPHAEYAEPLRIAPLRLGGVPRSSGRQLLLVGDAAGQTDPLTGEGIHTGMIGGRIAAETIREMLARGDCSEAACARYHRRWMAEFGSDFASSARAARLTWRVPLLLDAANAVAQRRGDAFMDAFGAAMTGLAPKTSFLRPSVAGPLALEIGRQLLRRRGLGTRAATDASYALGAAADPERATAFRNACLRDPDLAVLATSPDA